MNEHPTVISTSLNLANEATTRAGREQDIVSTMDDVATCVLHSKGDGLSSPCDLEQLSDEEFWRYARKLANCAPAPALAQPAEHLVCKLSEGQCLVPLATLYEVVQPPHRLALLPAVPLWMPGIVAWRGETIAVIDLDAYLTGQHMDLPGEGMLLVADYAGLPLGLLVSSIGQSIPLQNVEIADSPGSMINRASPWYLPTRTPFVKGIQDRALVLDVPLLLADVVQEIETAASNA